ncbi:class I SAM-dependent methyltransferase [Shivajiella indica]|uniref:Class I SAM-dependent methyltransferase n=1 Tax=Shivajiella indica TaxID=872115 RepID=A0ABW5BG86_9BACT
MENKERLKKCPLCKSGHFLNFREAIDYSVSKEKFMLCRCTACQLIFTNPRPNLESISQYYQSENYISHQNKANNLTNILYKLVRNITLRHKLNWINEFAIEKGNLLDYGCGTGHFLKKAKQNGWKVIGVEPNPTARKITKSKKIKVHSEINKIKKEFKFKAITLFHVLEHIHELRKIGKKIVSLLEDKGYLFIAVPNINSKDSIIYGDKWAGLDVPRHLYHFTPETMEIFAQEMDLIIIDKKPMKFDSYYVSLLSEKYLDPNSSAIKQFIKGFFNGYSSNRYAKGHQFNYSSILFILKKK